MYKQQCEKAAGRKDNHSNGEGVPQLQGPSPNPIPPYCHKLRLWGCQRAPGCAGPQAVSTGAKTSPWDTVQKNTASLETQAKRPTTPVKPLQLQCPSTAPSSTPGPEHRHLEEGEANLLQVRAAGGRRVLKTQPWKMSPPDDRAE